jgi:hypothetical protein
MWVDLVRNLVILLILIGVFQFFFAKKKELYELESKLEALEDTVRQLRLRLAEILGPPTGRAEQDDDD